MEINIYPSWDSLFHEPEVKSILEKVMDFVEEERKNFTVYPSVQNIFKAFEVLSLDEIKVVILGQDPYHQKGQAHGLAFSVPKGVKVPPSLQNIYKELKLEYPEFIIPHHGDLTFWAKQGVLLLNTTLTVRENTPASHAGKGWENFTDWVIKWVSQQNSDIVFMLWGKHAQQKEELIENTSHLILKAAHPSPFSSYRGFFGCQHFKIANEYLLKKGRPEINWQIPIDNMGSNLEIEFPI